MKDIPKAPVVLYDGSCVVCNGLVDYLLKHDKKRRLRFQTLESEAARAWIRSHGYNPDQLNSVVLLHRGAMYTASTAVLEIAKLLGGLHPVLAVGYAVPKPLRDGFYAWFARNRYRWFGQAEQCRLLKPEERSQMLGAD